MGASRRQSFLLCLNPGSLKAGFSGFGGCSVGRAGKGHWEHELSYPWKCVSVAMSSIRSRWDSVAYEAGYVGSGFGL